MVQEVNEKQVSTVTKEVIEVKKETVSKNSGPKRTNLTKQGKYSKLMAVPDKQYKRLGIRKRAWRVIRHPSKEQQQNNDHNNIIENNIKNKKKLSKKEDKAESKLLKPDDKLLQEWLAQDIDS